MVGSFVSLESTRTLKNDLLNTPVVVPFGVSPEKSSSMVSKFSLKARIVDGFSTVVTNGSWWLMITSSSLDDEETTGGTSSLDELGISSLEVVEVGPSLVDVDVFPPP